MENSKLRLHLESQMVPNNKLTRGYRIDLPNDLILHAEIENINYAKHVWGVLNSPLNEKIKSDEVKIIRNYLVNCDLYNKNVLECGCGSGRVSAEVAMYSKQLTMIDINEECKKNISFILEKYPNSNFKCLSFEDFNAKNFTSILFFENLIGMVLDKSRRIRIYNKVSKSLKNGGVCVFGIRTTSHQDSFFQLFSYKPTYNRKRLNLYGISINWVIQDFVAEIHQSDLRNCEIILIKGCNRPSGGKMYYVVIKK